MGLSLALQLLYACSVCVSCSRGLSRYIKRKNLDPLETYVPLVLEARGQLDASGALLAKDKDAARSLLRSGAFSGLRDNIRALGEYAVTNGKAMKVRCAC